MSEYHDEIPQHCFPMVGIQEPTKIYRACRSHTIDDWDLLSHAERRDARADMNKCESWGLSVWVTKEAVSHAQGLFKFLRNKYIFTAVITPMNGCLKHTPSDKQLEHYTFWKKQNPNMFSLFSIYLEEVV